VVTQPDKTRASIESGLIGQTRNIMVHTKELTTFMYGFIRESCK